LQDLVFTTYLLETSKEEIRVSKHKEEREREQKKTDADRKAEMELNSVLRIQRGWRRKVC